MWNTLRISSVVSIAIAEYSSDLPRSPVLAGHHGYRIFSKPDRDIASLPQ
jgi:hypothetical protein